MGLGPKTIIFVFAVLLPLLLFFSIYSNILTPSLDQASLQIPKTTLPQLLQLPVEPKKVETVAVKSLEPEVQRTPDAAEEILVDDGNLFPNPGFEYGLSNWNSWGRASTVTEPVRSGKKALKTGGMDSFNIAHRLVPGTTYRLTVWARQRGPGKGHVGVILKNAARAEIFNKLLPVTTRTYQEYSIDFTFPAEAIEAKVLFYEEQQGPEMFVDDVELKAILPAKNLVYVKPSPIPANGVAFPFGSRKGKYIDGISPNHVSPADQDKAIRIFYDKWKAFALKANCGNYYVAFNGKHLTVSEGVSYGMLIAVTMAGYDPLAKDIFDGLFKFARAHGSQYDPHLMSWAIKQDCNSGDGANAVDGDLDIAMALLMADKQWGSTGEINYLAEALKTIKAMRLINFHTDGRILGGNKPDLTRTSDCMIGHFRAFKKVTQDPYWETVINKCFELMATMQSKFAPQTGLLPGWIQGLPENPSPSPGERIESKLEGDYDWNSNRIPMRLAMDFAFSADSRSRLVTQKIMSFMQSSSGGVPANLAAGYKLNGTPLWKFPSLAFVGPNAAGATVDPMYQNFLNSLWSFTSGQAPPGYYDNELALLSMLLVSRNWWTP